MTDFRSAGRATGLLLIVIAFVVAACGGAAASGSPGASTGSAPSAGASAATPTPTPTPTTADGSTEPEPSEGAFPTFDVSAVAEALKNVDSYRVTISVDGVEQYSGVVVTKPVLSRQITMNGTTKIIVIGSDAWMAEGDEPYQKVSDQMAQALLVGFDPTLFVAMFSGPGWAESALDKGHEDKNGVPSTHYYLDSTTLIGGFAGVPEGASIDLWIADEGYLVAWESTGFAGAGNLSIEVTNVDDPANKVEAPS